MVKPHASNPRAVRERKHANRRFYKENPMTAPEPSQHDQMMAMLEERVRLEEPVIERLIAENPDLHPITAHIMAGDILSADRATEEVLRGDIPAEKAIYHVGSFARWDWALAMMSRGLISKAWFDANICDLWRGSDPDDTNPGYLTLWREAKWRNGGYIRDGRPLPRSRDLQVYRGGQGNLTHGIAWTLDPKIAQKFAQGAGSRVQIKGVVIRGAVKRGDVIAYITGRDESEVIVDPRAVQGIHITGGYA